MQSGKTDSWESVERWGQLSPDRIWGGAYWGLLTSVFVHADIVHLAFNVYWLWLLAGAFERTVGGLRWIAFFLVAAWISSGLQLLSGAPGIGMSGVVYALVGLGWAGRQKVGELGRLVDERTVRLFLGWGLLCFLVTVFGVMSIGNAAHAGGLLFGVLTARLLVNQRHRALIGAGIGGLAALSVVSLFWCPWSWMWNASQGGRASARGRYDAAAQWYRRSLELNPNASEVWENLARVYGYQQRPAEYAEALQHLRRLEPKAADRVEATYGKAAASRSW